MTMKTVGRARIATLCSMTAALIFSLGVRADVAPTSPSAPSIPGWDQYVDALRELAPKMLNKLPLEMRNDPQIQQEVARLMLSSIAQNSLVAIGNSGDHPVFLPLCNDVISTCQPNADTVYKKATITPGGTYRLRGRKGSLRMATIGTLAPPGADGKIKAGAYFDINKLKTDRAGYFDVLLSPTKPANYLGDWWPLDQNANLLLLRQVALDWSKERDPTLSIERVDGPVARPRPSAAEMEQRLRQLPAFIDQAALMLVDHTAQLQKDGYVNKFKVWDVVASFGGLFGQFYYESAYDLKDDEALIVESEYPQNCSYASLLLANPIFETIDWDNNHSSLNAAQWHVNADGRLRVVVSAKDPGVQNWLDTAGYSMGVIQGRWTGCSTAPIPSARKVAIGEVRALLPADTRLISLEQRDRIIRDRRAQYQQRVHW